jgi:hypothetical protein
MVQIVSTLKNRSEPLIPPTGVGGLFRSYRQPFPFKPQKVHAIENFKRKNDPGRKDLKHPPTAVGGITLFVQSPSS